MSERDDYVDDDIPPLLRLAPKWRDILIGLGIAFVMGSFVGGTLLVLKLFDPPMFR